MCEVCNLYDVAIKALNRAEKVLCSTVLSRGTKERAVERLLTPIMPVLALADFAQVIEELAEVAAIGMVISSNGAPTSTGERIDPLSFVESAGERACDLHQQATRN